MNFKIFFLGIMLVLLSTVLSAQEKLKGKVLSSVDKSPVSQAQISSPSAAQSVITDENGEFTIEMTTIYDELTVERSGFVTKSVYVGKKHELTIWLTPAGLIYYNAEIDLPAGAVNSVKHTGSSVMLNKRDLNLANNTPDESLHGMMAGLRVLNKGGMPGEGNYVNLRGIRSLNSTNAPLIVVDGMPYLPDMDVSSIISGFSRNIFTPVNLKEVENITLVKGAEAFQYGSLGSNGVILINSEKASDLETKVEFHTVEGVRWMNKRIPLLSNVEFTNYIGDIGETRFSDQQALVEQFPFLKDDDNFHYNYVFDHNTDWQEEIYTRALTSENILKVKGGDAIANYALSVGYQYNKGVEEKTDMSKFFTRLNANMEITKKLKMFASVGFSYSNYNLMEQGMVKETNPLLAALYKSPLFGVYETDQHGVEMDRFSKIDYDGTNPEGDIIGISNPKALVSDVEAQAKAYDVLLNAGARYNINSTLSLNALVGVYYNYDRQNIFIPGKTSQAIARLTDGVGENTVRSGNHEGYNVYVNANAAYQNVFGHVHGVEAMLGYQMLMDNRETDISQGINTASDFYKTLGNTSEGFGRDITGKVHKWNWMNMYARVGYNYKQQLYVNASVTADGASSTGDNSDRFAILPAANVAWKIGNASFLRNSGVFEDLTIRGEYAQLANSRFPNHYAGYYYNSQMLSTMTGIVRGNIPNSKLKSEVVHSYTAGLDIATRGHKFFVSADYYREETHDLLNQQNLGAVYGFGYVYNNAGKIRNEGVEVSLQAQLLNWNGFQWYVGGNITTLKSKIINLGGTDEEILSYSDGTTLIQRVGETPYSFYGVESDGIFCSQAEADAAAVSSHTGRRFNAGDVRFRDVDGNQLIDDRDRKVLGKALPDFYGGFYTSLHYKGFGVMAQFTYSYGNDIYNAVRRNMESLSGFENQSAVASRRWTFDGQQTDMPKAQYGDPMGNSRFSDRWIEDGSYLKLKNITLSYDLQRKLGFIQQAQIYLTGENLFTATKYLGLDPEFSYSYANDIQGIDMGKVPLGRSIRLGIKLNF